MTASRRSRHDSHRERHPAAGHPTVLAPPGRHARSCRTGSARQHRIDPPRDPGHRRTELRRGAPQPPAASPRPEAPSTKPCPGAGPQRARLGPAPGGRMGGRDPRPHETVRDQRRRRRGRAARPARLRLRLPGPERCGQDHADPHLARPDPGRQRHDVPARHRRPSAPRPRPRPGRRDRRRASLPPAPDRAGEPPPAGRGQRRRRGQPDRAVAGPSRPGRPSR